MKAKLLSKKGAGLASLKSGLSWGRRGTARVAIARSMRFENLSHFYGKTRALENINLTFEPGQISCLLGHSGSGKSTLLRIAAGVERASRGRFLVDEREYCGPSAFVPAEKRGIGLMFQDFALFPHLTVLKNVMFGLTDLPSGMALNEARLTLERVGLADFALLYPHQLSGGEQQRVALARAVAPRPGILLMDEPFSGLDQALRNTVREETLAILREIRATCLMVTHDPEEAMRVCERIVLLKKGRVVQDGVARELYHHPADLTVARFFSEINQFEGRVRDKTLYTPMGAFPAPDKANGAVDVCIRHQDTKLCPVEGADKPAGGRHGRIIRCRFLGEVELAEVVIEGLESSLHARVRSAQRLAPGTEVWAWFDAKDLLIFEKAKD